MRSKFNGKFWWDMTEEEHRAYPGDYEAQVGQGPITLHSEEHFGQSDRGVLMVRRMLREQLDLLEAGKDPAGVSFDPNGKPIAFEAGNYIREMLVALSREVIVPWPYYACAHGGRFGRTGAIR